MSRHNSVDFLNHYAFQLKKSDPKVYESFLAAFDAYATEITVAVTDAQPADILHMQGRAKQTLVLLELLKSPKPITSTPQPQ